MSQRKARTASTAGERLKSTLPDTQRSRREWLGQRKMGTTDATRARDPPMPIEVGAFPGSGISANLADTAKKLRILVWRFDQQSWAKIKRATWASR